MILPATPEAIARAAEILLGGGIVAVPTETVYGLAARAADGEAVARIYAAKGRPAFNPLIVHIAGREQAATLVDVDALAARLMAAFWPGPLTLVLPMKPGAPIAALVTAGLPTLAVRAAAHPVMQALIAAVGPLAAPSANASGRLSPTRASHVAASFGGNAPLILDDGAAARGIESTIVAVAGKTVTLLRPGAVALEAIAAALAGTGAVLTVAAAGSAVSAPGMMASHYAPRLPLRLDAAAARPDEFHLGFGSVTGDASLSPSGDLVEAAARLFDLLHVAEASGRGAIAVAPVPDAGLGAAINDRLRRAAVRD